jgi:hypothetical protein
MQGIEGESHGTQAPPDLRFTTMATHSPSWSPGARRRLAAEVCRVGGVRLVNAGAGVDLTRSELVKNWWAWPVSRHSYASQGGEQLEVADVMVPRDGSSAKGPLLAQPGPTKMSAIWSLSGDKRTKLSVRA